MSHLCLNSFNNFYYQEFNKMIADAKLKSSKNLMLIYKKVSLSIKKYPFPILTSANSSSLEGVGETIRKVFDNLIKQYKEKLIRNSTEYIQLAYQLTNTSIINKAKKAKAKASKTKQDAPGSSLRVAKIKNLVNIPLYSSLWTSVISSYLIFFQTNSITISVDDIVAMSKTLYEQFQSINITIEESIQEDFKEMKLLDIVDSFERDKKIRVNDYLIKLSRIELKKIGIEVEKDEDGEINFTMSQLNDDYNSVNRNVSKKNRSNTQQTTIVNAFNLFSQDSDDNGNSNATQQMSHNNINQLNWNEELPISNIASKFKRFISKAKESTCNNITLIIDNREKGSNNENFKEEILNTNNNTTNPLNIDERNLSLGDFIWIYTDPNDSIKYVIDYIIERKTLNDLASSIIDGRYNEQKYRLKVSGFSNITYLFEGTSYSNEKNISKSALNTAINNTMTIHDINAIKTHSTKDTVRYLLLLDSYIKRSCGILRDKNNNKITFDEYMKLNAKTKNASVESVFVQQLRTFNNCGSRSVELIRNVFKCPLYLYRVINRCNEENVSKEEMLNLINIANYLHENKVGSEVNNGNENANKVNENEIVKYFKKEHFSKIKKGIKSVKKIRKDTVASIINFYLSIKDKEDDEDEEGNKAESNKENINNMIID